MLGLYLGELTTGLYRSKQIALTGLSAGSDLRQIIDSRLRPIALPPDGLLLTRKLGEILGMTTGDTVTLEVLEGARERCEVTVAGLSDELVGISAYMDARALGLLREDNSVSGAWLRVDPVHADTLYAQLKRGTAHPHRTARRRCGAAGPAADDEPRRRAFR